MGPADGSCGRDRIQANDSLVALLLAFLICRTSPAPRRSAVSHHRIASLSSYPSSCSSRSDTTQPAHSVKVCHAAPCRISPARLRSSGAVGYLKSHQERFVSVPSGISHMRPLSALPQHRRDAGNRIDGSLSFGSTLWRSCIPTMPIASVVLKRGATSVAIASELRSKGTIECDCDSDQRTPSAFRISSHTS
jgi:hypothetical protein